ncbi:hypothetical protein AZE42_10042 [Rhizopogon vesiculosus]|uniref:Uncharacterized protein n=1 Tax=Rhizopogon vesiculosus TaxID=180088 RepID=A0A1J8PV95_9AGAM|nr:hypothetical protein AZE42_10042 [Rhizopogon vesiculosus]
MAHHITQAISSTMEMDVPFSKPCPHSKRWWTRDLTHLCQCVNHLSRKAYQMRGLPNHPCHEELKTLKNDDTGQPGSKTSKATTSGPPTITSPQNPPMAANHEYQPSPPRNPMEAQ